MAAVGGVISGWLTKRGDVRKNWKRRFFVLQRDGFLKYYESELDSAVSSPKNLIDLRNVSVITTGNNLSDWPDTAKATCRMALVSSKRVFYFYSDTQDEARQWLTALNRIAGEVCRLRGKSTRSVPSSLAASHAAAASVAESKGASGESISAPVAERASSDLTTNAPTLSPALPTSMDTTAVSLATEASGETKPVADSTQPAMAKGAFEAAALSSQALPHGRLASLQKQQFEARERLIQLERELAESSQSELLEQQEAELNAKIRAEVEAKRQEERRRVQEVSRARMQLLNDNLGSTLVRRSRSVASVTSTTGDLPVQAAVTPSAAENITTSALPPVESIAAAAAPEAAPAKDEGDYLEVDDQMGFGPGESATEVPHTDADPEFGFGIEEHSQGFDSADESEHGESTVDTAEEGAAGTVDPVAEAAAVLLEQPTEASSVSEDGVLGSADTVSAAVAGPVESATDVSEGDVLAIPVAAPSNDEINPLGVAVSSTAISLPCSDASIVNSGSAESPSLAVPPAVPTAAPPVSESDPTSASSGNAHAADAVAEPVSTSPTEPVVAAIATTAVGAARALEGTDTASAATFLATAAEGPTPPQALVISTTAPTSTDATNAAMDITTAGATTASATSISTSTPTPAAEQAVPSPASDNTTATGAAIDVSTIRAGTDVSSSPSAGSAALARDFAESILGQTPVQPPVQPPVVSAPEAAVLHAAALPNTPLPASKDPKLTPALGDTVAVSNALAPIPLPVVVHEPTPSPAPVDPLAIDAVPGPVSAATPTTEVPHAGSVMNVAATAAPAPNPVPVSAPVLTQAGTQTAPAPTPLPTSDSFPGPVTVPAPAAESGSKEHLLPSNAAVAPLAAPLAPPPPPSLPPAPPALPPASPPLPPALPPAAPPGALPPNSVPKLPSASDLMGGLKALKSAPSPVKPSPSAPSGGPSGATATATTRAPSVPADKKAGWTTMIDELSLAVKARPRQEEVIVTSPTKASVTAASPGPASGPSPLRTTGAPNITPAPTVQLRGPSGPSLAQQAADLAAKRLSGSVALDASSLGVTAPALSARKSSTSDASPLETKAKSPAAAAAPVLTVLPTSAPPIAPPQSFVFPGPSNSAAPPSLDTVAQSAVPALPAAAQRSVSLTSLDPDEAPETPLPTDEGLEAVRSLLRDAEVDRIEDEDEPGADETSPSQSQPAASVEPTSQASSMPAEQVASAASAVPTPPAASLTPAASPKSNLSPPGPTTSTTPTAPTTTAPASTPHGLSAPAVQEVLNRRLSVSVQQGQLPKQRALAAVQWVDKELRKLIEAIQEFGTADASGAGIMAIKFGVLFVNTDNRFEAISGTLNTAKKRGIVAYESEMLLQGRDDALVVLLLRDTVPESDENSYAQNKCAVCGKTVYAVEFVGANDKAFHKACFRCTVCKGPLRSDNMATINDKFYCQAHYEQAFKQAGCSYDGAFT